jgi:membrane dipeptidase
MVLVVLSIPCMAQSLSDAQLHEKAIVVEAHAHVINSLYTLGLDPWKEQTVGTIDYARARKGGVDVIVEQLYVEDEYNDYNYTVKQAVRLIETFYRVLDANRDKMDIALTSQDVRRIVGEGKLAIILALEGGFDMEGDPDVLRLFARLGVRMIQVVNHETTNAMADAEKLRWQGLGPRGRAVLEEMNRLGIVIDISHASDAAKLAMIEASRAPVVTSHNGLKHFSPKMRGNMTDEALDALAHRGGVLGLHSAAWILSGKSLDWGFYWGKDSPTPAGAEAWGKQKAALKGRDRIDYGDYIAALDALMVGKWQHVHGYDGPWRERQAKVLAHGAHLPTVSDWADEIDYIVKRVGPDHAGIGLDLMSGGHWLRDFDATSYPRLTTALRAKGYSDETVMKILGENWLRVLDAAKVK